jgi:aspartyl-tRNA synthetase
MYRTHSCNDLRKEHVGQTVTLCGWVNTNRDHHGVIFIDLRDREGMTQIVFRPEEKAEVAEASHKLRGEDVVQISGRVDLRLPGTENAKLATGDIEVIASELKVLNKAEVPPFPLDDPKVNEDLRLEHRYLDLRTGPMQRNLKLRHRVAKTTRDYLDERGFLEIETPVLSNPTPEGARDFLVPSRLNPGTFYALPQAPQQYKQLLQVAGLEKYFQIARCFRDEDLRADRQPEFTQIDIEASFIAEQDIQDLIEGLLVRIFRGSRGVEIPVPFPRMTFEDAMNRYGSDKPDTRFGIELVDVGNVFRESQFKVFRAVLDGGGVLKALNAKGAAAALSKEQLKKWEEWVKTEFGAKGLAYIKWAQAAPQRARPLPDGNRRSSNSSATRKRRRSRNAWDLPKATCSSSARTNGNQRAKCSAASACAAPISSESFPRTRLISSGLPISRSWPSRQRKASTSRCIILSPVRKPKTCRCWKPANTARCVLSLTTWCSMGGTWRRFDSNSRTRSAGEDVHRARCRPEEQQHKFGHLLKAFSFGAPPHGGIALGLDRLVMLIAGAESIREVIAFPKEQPRRGLDD